MMKKYLLSLLLLPCLAFGQARFGLLDSIELEKLQNSASALSAAEQKETMLTLLMRVDSDEAAARVEAAGAVIEQREGDIIVASVPLWQAEAIAATEGIVTASLSKDMHLHAQNTWGNDLSRSTLGLTDIFAGTSPLTRAYTGEGVVVGIVDMGIDLHHASFLNDDGTHRVKTAWKHVVNGKSSITITSDTEEKIAKFHTDDASMTHGTHVMGIAVGSYIDDEYDFRGAAPDAEIVVSCGVADNAHMLKGLRSIVDYAKAKGKPCVINMSLGNNAGPHDGTDEFPAALNAIAAEDNVSIFVSAGNEGDFKAFIYKQLDNKPLKTVIAPSLYTSYLYPTVLPLFPQAYGDLEIWSGDSTPFTVYLDLLKVSNGTAEVVSTFTVPTDGSTFISTAEYATDKYDVVLKDDAGFNAVYKTSFVHAATGLYAGNNRYRAEMAFQLECKSEDDYKNCYMSIRIEGTKGQEIYINSGGIGGVYAYELQDKGLADYTASDGNGSISAMAGADNVVTVGAYHTHNFRPITTWGSYATGTTASYTSWGHTPDGREHPLICAPGTLIVSALSDEHFNSTSYSADSQPVYYQTTGTDGKTHRFTPMTGTSMASPFMAGVAATWLSADPSLTTADILQIAQETADAPKTPKHNDGAGGHLNAFRGLCRVLGLSGIGNVKVDKDIFTIDRQGSNFTVKTAFDTDIRVTLHNLQGAPVLSAATECGNELSLDATSLAKGVYILAVKAGDARQNSKVSVY